MRKGKNDEKDEEVKKEERERECRDRDQLQGVQPTNRYKISKNKKNEIWKQVKGMYLINERKR